MAKPKVVKVPDGFTLKDLFVTSKLVSGQRVCLLLPLRKTKKVKNSWKFVRGTFFASYKTYCECCGPEFHAYLEKADGTKMELYNDWRRSADCVF